MVFVYSPLEKAFPEYRWWFCFFLAMPIFFASFYAAFTPIRLEQAPSWSWIVLVLVPMIPLVIVALILHDVTISLLR